MLLPGQWLQDLPFTPTSSPQHLTENDIKRMKLWAPILENPELQSGFGEKGQLSSDARLTVRAAQNRIQGNLQDFSEYKVLLSFAAFSLFYGGIHATSWENYFPSEIERTMWQIAVCIVIGGGIVTCVLGCIQRRWTLTSLWPLGKGSHLEGRTKIQAFIGYCLGLNIKCLVLVSISARLFLVVEAFISIRRLPIAAYDTVNWARFLPHII